MRGFTQVSPRIGFSAQTLKNVFDVETLGREVARSDFVQLNGVAMGGPSMVRKALGACHPPVVIHQIPLRDFGFGKEYLLRVRDLDAMAADFHLPATNEH